MCILSSAPSHVPQQGDGTLFGAVLGGGVSDNLGVSLRLTLPPLSLAASAHHPTGPFPPHPPPPAPTPPPPPPPPKAAAAEEEAEVRAAVDSTGVWLAAGMCYVGSPLAPCPNCCQG